MGGQVSSQRWDDLIDADFEKQKQKMHDISLSHAVPKTETTASAPKGADVSSVNKTETKGSAESTKQNESKTADEKEGKDEDNESKVESKEDAQPEPEPPEKPEAPKVMMSLDSDIQACEFAEFKLTRDPDKLSTREIYEIFQSAHNKSTGTNWAARPMLYDTAAKLLYQRGEPVMSDLVFHEGLKVVESPTVLAKLRLGKARTLAQTRSTKEAIALLQALPKEIQETEQDALNLFGRCYKDMAGKFGQNPELRRNFLKQSFRYYNDAFQQSGHRDSYPGINAATVAFLLHDVDTAHALANDVAALASETLEKSGNNYWDQATLGECNVILGAWKEAQLHYSMAMKNNGVTDRMRRSTRTQFRKLIAHVHEESAIYTQSPAKQKEFEECSESIEIGFHIPNVVVFLSNKQIKGKALYMNPSQSMIKSLDKLLEENKAGYCFSCAYPGPDLAFCEAVLRRGVELYVVLPLPQDVFRREEFSQNPKQAWRFDYIISKASSVDICNDMSEDFTPINYQYTCYWASGKATMKSHIVDTSMIRIHAPAPEWDKSNWSCDPWVIGHWRDRKEKFITWRACRLDPTPSDQLVSRRRNSIRRIKSVLTHPSSGPPQIIKAILFADVVGYSKLKEHDVFFFVNNFLGRAAELIRSVRPSIRPAVRNTWGDAFYFVFHSVRAGGVFSLLLRDMVLATRWEDRGLPATLSIRISMHAGPVFPCVDKVLNEVNFTGVHTSRAARIEPITRPGSVYCSRAFASLTAALGETEFSCEFIGNVPLAKKYGMLPVHVVEWRSKSKDGYLMKVLRKLHRSKSESDLEQMDIPHEVFNS